MLGGEGLSSYSAQQQTAIAAALSNRRAPILAGLGDSLLAQLFTESAGSNYHYQPYSIFSWIRQQLMDVAYINPDYNFATAGYTSQQIKDINLPRLLASGAHKALIIAGQNDFGATAAVSAATTSANIIEMANRCGDKGIEPIVVTPPPLTADMNSTRQLVRQDVFHRLEDAFDTASGVTFINTEFALANDDGSPRFAHTDGKHYSTACAQVAANIVAPIIAPKFNHRTREYGSQVDVYDATSNPRGNLYAYGRLSGTGGTGGTGVSGDLAANHTIDNFTAIGSRGTAALVGTKLAGTAPDAAEWQVLTGSGTPTADFTWRVRPTSNITTNVAQGDIVYAEAEYYVASGAVGLMQAGMRLAFNTNAFFSRDIYYITGADGIFQTIMPQSGKCRTEPFVVDEVFSSLTPVFEITQRNGVAASFEVRVRNIQIKKVIA